MANASLILEIALLLLVAFLAGCTLGWLARKLTRRRRTAVAIKALPAPQEAAAAPLVVAPRVSPLFQRSPGPTAVQRQTAATGRSPVQSAPPATQAVAPSMVGLTPEQPPQPPRPERLPARVAGEVSMPKPTAAEPEAPPVEATPAEDPEAAARQAVEGGWTPPRRRSPEPFPEAPLAPALDPAAVAAETPEAAESADVAMAGARSAVASAQAAAAAVLAATSAAEPPPEQPPEQPERPPEQPAPRRRFGAPPLLDTPRDGRKDNLAAIRGITPVLADALNRLGIFHYDQVAGWDGKAVVWVDSQLGLRGRIAREKWPEQARHLAARPRPVRARR